MDSEGYITITGRIKDLIIRGGENIHPLEVENCLFANDAVKEVSVVGIPDEKYGEVVAAFVVPVKGKDIGIKEVRGWVRERLSHHLGVLDFSNFLAGTVVQNIRFSESFVTHMPSVAVVSRLRFSRLFVAFSTAIISRFPQHTPLPCYARLGFRFQNPHIPTFNNVGVLR
jgi:acyl-CoA synthetase (AMP-forming)/AMP-acid ligase II